MNLFTAKLLSPVAHRHDWDQPRLEYLPRALYRSAIHRFLIRG